MWHGAFLLCRIRLGDVLKYWPSSTSTKQVIFLHIVTYTTYRRNSLWSNSRLTYGRSASLHIFKHHQHFMSCFWPIVIIYWIFHRTLFICFEFFCQQTDRYCMYVLFFFCYLKFSAENCHSKRPNIFLNQRYIRYSKLFLSCSNMFTRGKRWVVISGALHFWRSMYSRNTKVQMWF